MDLEDEIEEVAGDHDTKTEIISKFVKEHLAECEGYAIIYITKHEGVVHSRWQMAPWKLRGAMKEIESYLNSVDVRIEMQDKE